MYGLSLLVAFGMGFGACIFMGPLRCLQCQCDATGEVLARRRSGGVGGHVRWVGGWHGRLMGRRWW